MVRKYNTPDCTCCVCILALFLSYHLGIKVATACRRREIEATLQKTRLTEVGYLSCNWKQLKQV